jgi:DNA invertase Pin-like site-specific DNA recombinase
MDSATVNAITPTVDDDRSERTESMPASVPLRPAAYIRVADARSTQDVGMLSQREALVAAACERGWPEPAIYADTGRSGWQRPGSDLSRLTADIRTGQRDAVIVAELYRISRATTDVAEFAQLCADHGAPIETADDGRIEDAEVIAIHTSLTDYGD